MVKTKYIILYGNRRFEAFKKLGYNSIPAKIYGQNKLISLPLKNIISHENIRTEINDVSELMSNIKTYGLLHPIGVIQKDKFNQLDFKLINLTENIQRNNISPAEIGKQCLFLKEKYNMNNEEIASRLNMPITNVKQYINIFKHIPKKYHYMIGKGTNAKSKGFLTPTIIEFILNLRLNKKETAQLLDYTKKENLSKYSIRCIGFLLQQNKSLDYAIKNHNKYVFKHFRVMLNKKELSKLMEINNSTSAPQILKNILNKHSKLLI